ncbi:MAG: hypothetical protein EOO73_02335 [Myxococcales bacterium]|nr:MAG: hypothetical protein EOO73_02335 [Myxococcales bacterium]
MADTDSTQSQPSTSAPSGVAVPVLLIILAVILGAGALVLVVFGGWPAAILLLIALGMGSVRQAAPP